MKPVGIVSEGARDLFPGYFAAAMATGIDSIAAHLLGWRIVAGALFLIAVAIYAVLCALTLWRLCVYRSHLVADLTSHARGPGFLTIVAATSILGSEFVLLGNDLAAGFIFWLLACVIWLLLVYAFFTAVIISARKPDLGKGLHGGWLVVVVATQSLAVLGPLVASDHGLPANTILFVALALYLLGCAFYLLIIALILYRLAFVTLTPQEYTPDYWINMGASAISTLAGSTLILSAAEWPFLAGILPFLKGFTLVFWVMATWWIPLLAILEFWRHAVRQDPVHYAPRYWDVVFPLGMYTTCTLELGRTLALPFLGAIPPYFVYLALASWVLVFLSMMRQLWRTLTTSTRAGRLIGEHQPGGR